MATRPPRTHSNLETADELRHAREQLSAWQLALEEARAEVDREMSRCLDLFEAAPDAYLMTDVTATIRRANSAAASLLGIESRFLAGKPLSAFVDDTARRAFRKQLDLLCGTDCSTPWTFDLRRRDRTLVTVEVTIAALRDPGSGLREFRWLLRDVTKQKRAEMRIRQLNATLEQRVAERTRQLDDRTRQLERLSAERDDLLRALSHDVRMPLQSILAYAGLIELTAGDGVSPAVREYVSRIGQNTESVLRAVDALGTRVRAGGDGGPPA